MGIFTIAVIVGLLGETTFANVLKLITVLYAGVGESFQEKLNAYVTGDIPDRLSMNPIQYLLTYLSSIFFVLLFCYYRKKFFIGNQVYNVLLNLYVCGISFNRLFLQIIPDFARATSLFTGGLSVMLLLIVSQYHRRATKIVWYLVLILYFYFQFRKGSIEGYYKDIYIPYYICYSSCRNLSVFISEDSSRHSPCARSGTQRGSAPSAPESCCCRDCRCCLREYDEYPCLA